MNNFVKNYAIEAFRFYASIGEPTREEYQEMVSDRLKRCRRIRRKGILTKQQLQELDAIERQIKAEQKDILAVISTFEIINERRKNRNGSCGDRIILALRETYMNPEYVMSQSKGIISRNVIRLSVSKGFGERSVYRWLNTAINIFAEERGLRFFLKNNKSGSTNTIFSVII